MPFNPSTGARQWTPDGAKRVDGQRVDRPVTVDEKVQAVAVLTRDDEVAAQVATDSAVAAGALAARGPAHGWLAGVSRRQRAGGLP
ncbi:DUF6192 family protein [Streptomyces sp. NBC_00201]|uniref:DUF6192 family protein n=1 Tax=Streptomyces sp. NBC_00201 TaxID=2975679 RepID=UPI0022552C9C|nr:DUF6192 family protein [Streptomyces sp. NBC_00201]MCX5247185.1 DUF6192 family protein [Streptomyces sp. NBC_00201]